MAEVAVLRTNNEAWGCYGSALQRGWDPEVVWTAAFRALLEGVDGLTPEGARWILDAKWGRWFIDSLAERQASDPARIRRALLDYLAGASWKKLVGTLVESDFPCQVRRRVVEDSSDDPVEVAVLDIARRRFGVETLRVRGLDRLDFHSVSVTAISAALREAFEIGVALERAAQGPNR